METTNPDAVATAAAMLRECDPAWRQRRLGLILGSGWGAVAESLLEVDQRVDYADIPGFPQSTVDGHAGRLLLGRVGDCPLWCLQGRFHYYEGHSPEAVVMPVRVLAALGARGIVLTNAAGGIRESFRPGDLMIIRDHMNFMGMNPLRGANDERVGPRFPDMTVAWDADWRAILWNCGEQIGTTLQEGVYLAVSGPNFETPAEVRAFGALGADAVGMSTVPECLIARHAGLRVAGLSCITNAAAGLGEGALTHEEVGQAAREAQTVIEPLLGRALPLLHQTLEENGSHGPAGS